MTPADLRQWRVTHNLKRTDLAERLPCAEITVRSWETGARNIPAWLIRALRDIERELNEKDA